VAAGPSVADREQWVETPDAGVTSRPRPLDETTLLRDLRRWLAGKGEA